MVRCPGCAALAGPDARGHCPACGAWLAGPQAAELRWIAAELARLDAARGWLVARRAVLLADLWPDRRAETAGGAAPAGSWQPPPARGTTRTRPELSRAAVANLLLAAGGLLVVVAAAVFTAANWSVIAPGGRAAILLAMSVLALAAPWPLARRGLTATAESVAAIGLALTAAAAYLAQQQIRAGTDARLGLAAAGCAVLAVAWAGYGTAAPPKGPRLAAIGLAQFPVPLAVAAATQYLPAVALALVLTAGGDLALASWFGRKNFHAERLAGAASAAATWTCGVVLASATAAGGLGPHQPFILSAVFAAAAITGVLGAPVTRAWVPAGWVTAASGALAAIALALPAAAGSPDGWQAGVFAAAGAAVAGPGWWLARRWAGPDARDRGGSAETRETAGARAGQIAAGGAAVLGTTGLAVVPAVLSGLLYPLTQVGRIWAGPPLSARAGLAPATAWHGSPATPGVLALAALACWWVPARSRSWARAAALAVAGMAAGSVPVTAGVPGRAALVAVTAVAAALLGTGCVATERVVSGTASVAGLVIAGSAALWSLTGRAVTIAELAVLTVILAAAAVAARSQLPAVLATAGAAAALAGLAGAVALAAGLPAREAAFAVLGVAAGAAGAATLVRRARPVQALVLDLCAAPLVVLAAAMAAQRANTFSVLATAAAAMATGTALVRAGRARSIALGGAAVTLIAAIGSQARPLVCATFLPLRHLIRPWHGISLAHPGGPGFAAAGWPELPLALVVLASCAITAVVAAGAWRGSRGSLDALAVALPVVAAPAAAVARLSFGITVGLLLALTLALTGWAAASRSLAPAGAALAAAPLTLVWALAGRVPTLVVLGCLTAAYSVCAWRARLPGVRAGAACLAVVSGGALAASSALAAGRPAWQAGLAVLASAALGQLAATLLARARPLPGLAVEASGWLAAVTGAALSLDTPQHASIALAVTGALCLGVALRPSRRPLLWAGLALGEAALCVWLAAMGVLAPEPYTVPAAAMLIAFGRYHSRRSPRAGSWATYGPGLAVLLLPSLTAAWLDHGWLRPLLLGVAATAVTLAGGRARLRAPLLLGATVAVLDAGHELTPAISQLVGMLPRWVPIAVIGVVLLGVGATYEARLRDLGTLRRALAKLR